MESLLQQWVQQRVAAEGAAAALREPVQFRAGKISMQGSTATADKRKGLVTVYEEGSGFVKFQWKDRMTNVVEDELLIFPEEAEWVKVKSAPASSRVFMLRFLSSDKRMLFWMQEPNANRDAEIATQLNAVISELSVESLRGSHAARHQQDELLGMFAQSEQRGSSSSAGGAVDMGYLQGVLEGMRNRGGSTTTSSAGQRDSQATPVQQAARVRTPAAPQPKGRVPSASLSPSASPAPVATTTASTTETTATTATATTSGAGTTNGAAAQRALAEARSRYVEAKAALVQRVLQAGAAANPELEQQLREYLPDGHFSMDKLDELLRSPQFKSALLVFVSALESGQMGVLMEQFGLPNSAGGGVDALLKALQGTEPPGATTAQQNEPQQQADMDLDKSKE